MAKRKYEILHGIRPDAERGTLTEGVVELTDEEAAVFLDREAIRLIPGQSAPDPNEGTDRGTPVSTTERETLSVPEEHGRSALLAAGLDTNEKVRAASDKDLKAVAGVNNERLKQIRTDVAGA